MNQMNLKNFIVNYTFMTISIINFLITDYNHILSSSVCTQFTETKFKKETKCGANDNGNEWKG